MSNDKKIKIIAIGDPHFKINNVIETDEMHVKIIEICNKIKPDIIVCLGDILDRHETIHVSPLIRSIKFLKDLSEITKLYVIIGNHDRPNNSNFLTDEHPFNALKEWKNTTVVDKVIFDIIYDYKFIFVPYVPPGRFNEALSTINNLSDDITAIFAHQEFYGAKMGAVTSLIGDHWPIDNPLIISGHIHDYDKLQSNIYYVGTPLQHAFGDNTDKTISLFTFITNKEYLHERIDLSLRKKKIVYLTFENINTYEPPDDINIKIVINGKSSEIKSLIKSNKIKELTKKGIKISYKHIPDDKTHNENIIINKQMSYLERLYLEISNDQDQIAWFEQLFGKIK